ncbi:hypothetical protein CRUP_004146 [Coryphaenoides rupestris]|nr:hypothetical protein CRUP_007037 [Coryphaenoides rupestris]KAG7256502.1 hypothetical protein CRUP_004146 [Coryphaenoides rupestris]
MHSHFARCNSIRVDTGCWMAYEKPNYSGYQYMLTRGRYSDHHRWLKIFERSDFGGKMMELSEDCPNLQDRFHLRDVSSCNVMEGYWILHEHANYRGRQYFLRPGEYNKHVEWGSLSSAIGSVRRITEVKQAH